MSFSNLYILGARIFVRAMASKDPDYFAIENSLPLSRE